MSLARPITRALPAIVTVVTACADSTTRPAPAPTPPASFDAQHALATVVPMTSVFDENTFQSFNASLSYSEAFFRSGSPTPFPVHGATYIYDPVQRYVLDPAATGAPAPGVRFVLYAWDKSFGHPVFPLQRIGYVDITPQTPAADAQQATHVVIVRDSLAATVADFVISHGVTAGVNVFSVVGFGTNGTTRVNVTVGGTQSGPDGAHRLLYQSTLSAPSVGVTAKQQLIYDQSAASQTGQSELTYESHTLTNESVGNNGELIKFDGTAYARIVVPVPGNPAQYLKPDGTALTQQEADDLQSVLITPAVAHFFWINLAWP